MSQGDLRTVPSLALELDRAMQSYLAPYSSDTDWCNQESLDDIQRQHDWVLRLLSALRSLGGDEAEEVLAKHGPASLVRVLRDSTRPSREREQARFALIALQDESVIDPLFEVLSEPGASSEAFRVFNELRSPKATALLPLAKVLVALECHGIERCLEAVKEAGRIEDRRTIPSLVHALERWIPRLAAEAPPGRDVDAKFALQLRVTIRRILSTLRSLGGEVANQAVQRYGSVLDKS